jgi:eukaryotic-like serine/threonine-protein kinase
MPLAPGNKLGPYEIIAPLGAGVMGEVYRALDTRLDRTVAIKILPSHLLQQPGSEGTLRARNQIHFSLNPSAPPVNPKQS